MAACSGLRWAEPFRTSRRKPNPNKLSRPQRRKTLPRRRLRRRNVDRELAIAVGERLRVDLLELDLAAHDALLPGRLRGIVLEFRHHLAAEQLQRFADVLVAVLARLVQKDDLVDVRALEALQLPADGLGRADQAAAQRGLLRLRI